MFQRNYLSGAFYQVFMGEIGRRIAWFFDKKNFNRNYTQQLDESIAFGEAIVRGLKNGRRERRKPFFEELRMRIATFFKRGDREVLEKWEGHSVPNYPRQPYLSYWYRHEEGNKMDGRLPLFFPVTFNIQTGRSGYPSPVSMNSGDKSVFIDAIDILADAEQKQNLKNSAGSLPMVGASQLSQLFPLMNAYTYIPGCGNFIDGGLFENQGLTLMIRLHDWLQAKIKTLPAGVRDRVKIRVLSALNGSIRPENDHPRKVTRISQLSGVMRAAGFSGIEGRTTWWGDYLCERIAPDKPIEFVLQFADSPADEARRVPLGRWLSRASIDLMEQRLDHPAIVEKRETVKRMLGMRV